MKANIIIRTELFKPGELIHIISDYCYKTGSYPNYLVMNRETYNYLARHINDFYLLHCCCVPRRKIYEIGVACCDSVEFGEVDVV